MKAKVLRGGWIYGDRKVLAGDEVEASPEQVAAWAADGYVQAIDNAPGPERTEPVENAEAEPAPENAARRIPRKKR